MPKISKKTYKDLYNFSFKNEIKNDSRFSHGVFLAEKIKHGHRKSLWITKFLGEKRDEAIGEILAQEIYRLILLQQPKTRRIISKTETGMFKYYVLSKEILCFDEQFFLLPSNNELILNNSITGLAATQVLALWLNEVDFKAGNVGVDDRKVIKIDGGLSFIKLNPRFKNLYEGKNLDITQADLEALPNLINYEACNWLYQIQWNLDKKIAIKKEPTALDKAINQSPHFKNELYQTIFRIISLPDELIRFFTQNYITNINDVTRFSDFIIARKLQLAWAAKQIPAFNEYCQSHQAREDLFDYLKYLRTFKTMGKSYLLDEFVKAPQVNNALTLSGNAIQEYLSIMDFALELDNYLQNLKQMTLGFDSNADILLQTSIISDTESLKKVIAEFLAAPTIIKEKALYETLKDIVENYRKIENSITLNLIESINKVLSEDKKIKKPIPTPRKNKATQSLSSISFFNTNYQEISAAYHQHNRDTPSHDFTLFNY